MSISLRTLACALFLSVYCSLWAQSSTRLGTDTEAPPQRLALLIGNSTYQHVPQLKNPKNDVDQLEIKLKALGFQTFPKYNLDHDAFVAAVSDFENKIEPGAIVLFYYSGHGVQVEGTSYLIPTTMSSSPTSAQLTGNGISLRWVRDHLGGAKLSLIILDACRTFARVSTKGLSQGLAPLTTRGSLIAYAADEGQVADDNDTETLSLFTKHLIAELDKHDETLCQLFERVREAVDKASGNVQFPFIYDGVIGEFVFNRATTGESQTLSYLSNTLGANKVWTTIQFSENPNDYAAFIGKEPQDKSHVKLASDRLFTLMSSTAKAVGIVPVKAQENLEVMALANQGERLFYERAYSPALEAYKKLVSLRPSEVSALYDYATCLLQLGHSQEAIQFYTKALQLDAEFPWAYYNRGVAYHLTGNFKAAIEDYDQALKRRPSYALGYNNLALAKRALGDFAGADADVAKTLSLDSHYAPAYYNRAAILRDTGNLTAAEHYKYEGKILTVPVQ